MIMNQQDIAAKKVAEFYETLSRSSGSTSFGSCPVDMMAAFVRICASQSCGKCVPCRVGLDRLQTILEKMLRQEATMEDLEAASILASAIYDSADCAIGFEAGKLVNDGLVAFRDDFVSHIQTGTCTRAFSSVPCSTGCPAHVDIPGYIACIGAGRYADAVRVIRNDNPFPSVCGLICEHPCENHCRRHMVDDAVNIRGLKRYAVEKAGTVPAPPCAADNGKKIAVLGGGPAGLTAAYFLRLKGYQVTIFEKRNRLGGMLRYGIPSYRLPDENLNWDIDVILSTGVEVRFQTEVGVDVSYDEIRKEYDALYISIGAHGAKRLNIEGEDAQGVLSAVELLGRVEEGDRPDFAGKNVVVVGGGNVAMDATRTAKRLGAKTVSCVYRRRIVDMTALPEEVSGAQSEGCEILQLMAPVRVATADDKVTGLVVQPQLAGPISGSRPAPINASIPEETIPCDIIIVAIGQSIEAQPFAERGVDLKRGALVASLAGEVSGGGAKLDGVFTGGDCFTGPATVIRAIDAGKVAAANIDEHFGLHTPIECPVEIPHAGPSARLNWGRANMQERPADERKEDFLLMERCLNDEEAANECSRCLRCDHYGHGTIKGRRVNKW